MFKTANNDSISRPNSRPKLPFPGNGKGKFKMPREGKGREIWGLYSRESRETGIPAHPCLAQQGLSKNIHLWAQEGQATREPREDKQLGSPGRT